MPHCSKRNFGKKGFLAGLRISSLSFNTFYFWLQFSSSFCKKFTDKFSKVEEKKKKFNSTSFDFMNILSGIPNVLKKRRNYPVPLGLQLLFIFSGWGGIPDLLSLQNSKTCDFESMSPETRQSAPIPPYTYMTIFFKSNKQVFKFYLGDKNKISQ